MSNPPDVRYSLGKKDIGPASGFSWEHPIPINKFWDDLPFTVGRNFLSLFAPDEHIPIDPDSTLGKEEKLKFLVQLLRERLASKDAAAAPQTFYDVDYQGWDKLWLAIFGIMYELQDPDREQTIRMMIERRKNPSNLSHLHTLTRVLLDDGKYAEAESTEVPVRDWLDGKLGKDSPQSLGSRRMIAEAVWRQGRQSEAGQLLSEVDEIINESAAGRFAVYQDEQREMTQKLSSELKQEG